jgi:N-acetylglucosaminyl-diphospho-decaprenol L-rhamnosyltransferase
MNKLNNLTIIIVTFLTSKKILLNCLNSIDKRINVIIVENSSKFKEQDFFLKKFPKLKIFCTGSNLGYGNGNNFGIEKTKTEYALILNPDTVLDKNFCKNLKKILAKKNFSIIGCQYSNDKVFIPAGFFDSLKDKKFKKNYFKEKSKSLIKVEWVVGCAMLLNLRKFKDDKIFDNNFFLYFEEFDLCKSVIKKKKNIFLSKDLKIHHLGFKSSQSKNSNFLYEIEKLRNWHWMWSYFYFYKKNFNYFYALYKIVGKLFRSFFKSIIYFIVFDKINRDKYLYRFFGLLNSVVGKKSSYRGKLFF